MLKYRIKFLVSIVFILFTITAYAKDNIPKPVGYVNDFAHILKPKTANKINNILLELKKKTGVELVVVTIKKLQNNDIFDYSVELFEKWGIGEKGKDNGVLFLVDIGDKKLRIDTGYGMEGILPDGLLGRIRDKYILPYFKKGNYNKGILNGVMAIVSIIAKNYHVKITGSFEPKPGKVKKGISLINIILIIGLMLFVSPYIFPFFVGGVLGGYRSDWDNGLGGGFGGGLGGGFGGFGGGSTGGGGVGGSW